MAHFRASTAKQTGRRMRFTALAVFASVGLASTAANTQGGYPDERYNRGQQGYDQGQGYQQGYQQPGAQQGYSPREIRCRELEQQLAGDWTRGASAQDQLPRIDEDIRNFDRTLQRAEYDADRANCYEDMFIFGRSLRRTPRCLDLNGQIEDARRRLADLRQQRDNLSRSGSRRQRQDDLVAELARNKCGDNYQRQYAARQRQNSFFSLWDDEDSSPGGGQSAYQQPGNAPFGTYRTMCVRLCDGYYFPVSYSTLQSKFHEDEEKCRSQCAAPAELFVHRNPGEEVEQMVSLNGSAYAQMPYAFRNRKQYVKGCSCNASEYSLQEIAKSEQALKDEAESRRLAAAKPKNIPPSADTNKPENRGDGLSADERGPVDPQNPGGQSPPQPRG